MTLRLFLDAAPHKQQSPGTNVSVAMGPSQDLRSITWLRSNSGVAVGVQLLGEEDHSA